MAKRTSVYMTAREMRPVSMHELIYGAPKRGHNRHRRKHQRRIVMEARLSDAQIRRMVASGRIHPATFQRALGGNMPAVVYNPYSSPGRSKRTGRFRRHRSSGAMTQLGLFSGGGAARPRHAVAGTIVVASRRRRKSKSRKRLPPRGPGGRFRKRKSAARRVSAASRKRRRSPARYRSHKGRRYYSVRGRRGRYVTRYTPAYTRRERRWNNKRSRRKKHYYAVRTIPRGSRADGLIRLNPRTGEIIMPSAIVANPRRRRRRRRHASPVMHRKRRRRTASNPRRRRRRGHRRVASNPGMGSLMSRAKRAVVPGIAGAAGGALAGFVDTMPFVAGKPVISGVAKFATAILGATLLRKNAAAAYGFVGGAVGGLGYSIGVKVGGGLVAHSKGAALKGLADMASEDPELAGLLADADVEISDLVDMGDAADMAGDDDDMGDLVND